MAEPDSVVLLRETVTRLHRGYERTVDRLAAENPAVAPMDMCDATGRPILLDALTGLVNGWAVLARLDAAP